MGSERAWWVFVTTARKRDSSDYTVGSGFVYARGEEEALGFAYKKCREWNPEPDGWTGHSVDVKRCPTGEPEGE